jgi:hypothetical protein
LSPIEKEQSPHPDDGTNEEPPQRRKKILWPENPLKPKPKPKREGKIIDFLRD